MKYISLFSGIEAATAAWHPLGWEPLFFCEIEDFPSAVLHHHYPNVPNLKDVTTINEGKINVFKSRSSGKIDLLVGGSPCQSFSLAGHRKGLEDPRGNLMYEYIRMVEAFYPKWIIWENVPGVLSSNGGRDFGTLLTALAQLGYGIAYRVLDAQHFGVPQRRRRIFVVGCLGDAKSAFNVLFEPEGSEGSAAEGRKEGEEGSSQTQSSLRKHNKRRYHLDNELAGTLCARDYKGICGDDFGATTQKMVVERECAAPITKGNGEVRENEKTFTSLSNGRGQLGHGRAAVRIDHKVRRLTPRECERLQGFPDNYTQIEWNGKVAKDCPTGHRYKALGNSMAVPVMRWIGERIMKVEGMSLPQKKEEVKPPYEEVYCVIGQLAAGRTIAQNGLGIKKDISYTLDGTHVPAVREILGACKEPSKDE